MHSYFCQRQAPVSVADSLINKWIVQKALGQGIKNDSIVIEKYQFIINYKLNIPVKRREAGIQFKVNFWLKVWLGICTDEVILDKNISLLEINSLISKKRKNFI